VIDPRWAERRAGTEGQRRAAQLTVHAFDIVGSGMTERVTQVWSLLDTARLRLRCLTIADAPAAH